MAILGQTSFTETKKLPSKDKYFYFAEYSAFLEKCSVNIFMNESEVMLPAAISSYAYNAEGSCNFRNTFGTPLPTHPT